MARELHTSMAVMLLQPHTEEYMQQDPSATTIQLDIIPDGTRRYSLSEILINFDGDYLREFIKTHNKF